MNRALSKGRVLHIWNVLYALERLSKEDSDDYFSFTAQSTLRFMLLQKLVGVPQNLRSTVDRTVWNKLTISEDRFIHTSPPHIYQQLSLFSQWPRPVHRACTIVMSVAARVGRRVLGSTVRELQREAYSERNSIDFSNLIFKKNIQPLDHTYLKDLKRSVRR